MDTYGYTHSNTHKHTHTETDAHPYRTHTHSLIYADLQSEKLRREEELSRFEALNFDPPGRVQAQAIFCHSLYQEEITCNPYLLAEHKGDAWPCGSHYVGTEAECLG